MLVNHSKALPVLLLLLALCPERAGRRVQVDRSGISTAGCSNWLHMPLVRHLQGRRLLQLVLACVGHFGHFIGNHSACIMGVQQDFRIGYFMHWYSKHAHAY